MSVTVLIASFKMDSLVLHAVITSPGVYEDAADVIAWRALRGFPREWLILGCTIYARGLQGGSGHWLLFRRQPAADVSKALTEFIQRWRGFTLFAVGNGQTLSWQESLWVFEFEMTLEITRKRRS
jgi:hypothetical protein